MMNKFQILDRTVGLGQPPYFVARLEHEALRDGTHALRTLDAAVEAGAEAVEVQAPASLNANILSRVFKQAASRGAAVITSHYSEADLRSPMAPKADIHGLSYPLIIHQGLVSQAASTGRPMFLNTEACELTEIEAAYAAARSVGGQHMAILHHVGGRADAPANLHTLLDMSFRFDTTIGVADCSKGATTAIAAIALGASIVAKPFTMKEASPANAALTATEFAELTAAGHDAWRSLGLITYGLSDAEKATRAQRSDNSNLLAG